MSKYAFLDTPLGGASGTKIPPLKQWLIATILEKSRIKAYQTPNNPVYALGAYLEKRFGKNPDPAILNMTLENCAKKYAARKNDLQNEQSLN